MKTYTIIEIEQGKMSEPFIFRSKEQATKELADIIDSYKLDHVESNRYVNLQEAIEVTTWNTTVIMPV